jgi:hypothetical protein
MLSAAAFAAPETFLSKAVPLLFDKVCTQTTAAETATTEAAAAALAALASGNGHTIVVDVNGCKATLRDDAADSELVWYLYMGTYIRLFVRLFRFACVSYQNVLRILRVFRLCRCPCVLACVTQRTASLCLTLCYSFFD